MSLYSAPQEKPLQRETHAPQQSSPDSLQLEKAHTKQQKTQCSQKQTSVLGSTVRKHHAQQESEVKSLSRARLCDPMDSSLHQAPPSVGFSRQEYWSGVPFPSPGNQGTHKACGLLAWGCGPREGKQWISQRFKRKTLEEIGQ